MNILVYAALVIVEMTLNVFAAVRLEKVKKKGLMKCETDRLW